MTVDVDFLKLIEQIAKCQKIHITIIKDGIIKIQDFDFGLRDMLLSKMTEEFYLKLISQFHEVNVVYYITDFLDIEFCVLCIPESEREQGDYMIIGPYRDKILTEEKFMEQMAAKNIPKDLINEMKECYKIVPIVPEMEHWREFWSIICRTVNKSDKERTEYVKQTLLGNDFILDHVESASPFCLIEQEYADENRFLKAVSEGKEEEAIGIYNNWEKYKIKPGYKKSVREIQNSVIVLNTLLRKAAEMGGVHPVYLEELFHNITKQAETVKSFAQEKKLKIQMIRRYCTLVKSTSMKGYPPVIQKAVNYINMNLEKNLSLKRLGEECAVNASYLSALFKKEMQMNIIEYINQQRIRKAANLLRSNTMQIQDVAVECGIYDVNYFRKVFKKQMGMTPTEYLKQIKKIT